MNSWADRGMCHTLVSGGQYSAKDMDEIFFPTRGDDEKVAVARAKQICSMCPVVGECLDYALSFTGRKDFGVWGGTSVEERIAMKRAAV